MEQGEQQSAGTTGSVAPVTTSESVSKAASHENELLMGILAYVGILVIIPYLIAKENPFVKFHIKQGLVLLVIQLVIWVINRMTWGLSEIMGLLGLGVLILAIIGIVNVFKKVEAELPLVGKFGAKFTI